VVAHDREVLRFFYPEYSHFTASFLRLFPLQGAVPAVIVEVPA